MRPTVVRLAVVQPVVPSYRTAVFNALAEREGIRLTVYAGLTAPNAPPTADVDKFRFRFERAPSRRVGPFMSQPAQLKVVLCRRYDVVIFNLNARYVELLPALLMAKRTDVRTIVWGHGRRTFSTGSDSDDHLGLKGRVRNSVIASADATLFYSQGVADLHRDRGLSPVRAFVAPNALDQQKIELARTMWLESGDSLDEFMRNHSLLDSELFIYIGRLERHKRLNTLLDAVHLVRRSHPRVRLAIIGDGPERAELERQASQLKLLSCVSFIGALYQEEKIAPWCLCAVACVFPGNAGLGLLHAFGYGLPAVAADTGQTPEIEALEVGRNGSLFEAGNPVSLAKALNVMLDRPDLRTEMALAARATVEGHGYTLDRMLAGFEDAVQSVMQLE